MEIEHETSVICEASFSYQGCYCAVDILKRENDGWAIYEVKSSTVNEKNMKAVYVADVAYQVRTGTLRSADYRNVHSFH